MALRSYTFGLRLLKGFDHTMPARQAGMDRYAHNKLLERFRGEYRRTGRVCASRGRINGWYMDLRHNTGPGWLRQSVSSITRQVLYDLGRHYSQYVDTEYAKAAGGAPCPEYGEPRFKRYGDRISIPLRITHDNTNGDAIFLDDRTIHVAKMGRIRLSRPFPVPNYRPKTARLFQTADGKWRIVISCEIPDPEPLVGTPAILGVDRNIGNISTPDHTIIPPYKMVKRMQNAERTARRSQHTMSRRQRPDHRSRKPGSRRWNRAARRAAKNRRKAADIRHTMNHKKSRVIADSTTHAAVEDLQTQNMTKSARGTREGPGTNAAQKSGLNRSILNEGWDGFKRMLAYKMIGGLILVMAAYTSQTCSACGFVNALNRDGGEFLCLLCQYGAHADRNAAQNIENGGAAKLGGPVRRGRIKPRHMIRDRPATHAGNAHVKGRLDAEGSCVGSPMKRQASTGAQSSGTIVLYHDV